MGCRTASKNIHSGYKYVNGRNINGRTYWIFRIVGETRQTFKTEREAAIAADKHLIEQGKEPLNILVRK